MAANPSGNPFDRAMIWARERQKSDDIMALETQLDRTIRELVMRSLGVRTSAASAVGQYGSGFMYDGFQVRAANPASMQLVMGAGLGWQYDATSLPVAIDGILSLDDPSPYKPLSLTGDMAITVPTADPSNPRIDIIEVRYDRRSQNPLSRDILNPSTGAFEAASKNKTLSFCLDERASINGTAAINYKTGAAAGSPTPPTIDAGYIPVARINVPANASSIDDNHIVDTRSMLFPGGGCSFGVQFYTGNVGAPPTIVRHNAPPGVKVAVQNSGVYSRAGIVVIAGGTGDHGWGTGSDASSVPALGAFIAANAQSLIHGYPVLVNPHIPTGAITYAEPFFGYRGDAVTALPSFDGATWAPAVNVGVGQRYFFFDLEFQIGDALNPTSFATPGDEIACSAVITLSPRP